MAVGWMPFIFSAGDVSSMGKTLEGGRTYQVHE